MKRRIAFFLSAVLMVGTLAGCSAKTDDVNQGQTKEETSGSVEKTSLGQADNEIMTYEPIDPEKTTLFVNFSSSYMKEFHQAFEKKNPDIQIIEITGTMGEKTGRPLAEDYANGVMPDIQFIQEGYFTPEETKKYFENQSASEMVQNYEAEALNRVAVDDNIYLLPGPSSIYCMLYNKTLFDQYGWKIPTSFDEFVDLCVQIREDTNGTVQPWNPNAKYVSQFSPVTTSFVYEELFNGLENRTWYDAFCAGEETFAGHMEPYYDMIQKLIDNGILLEEHFSYSATSRGEEFENGQIAMYNYNVGSSTTDKFDIQYMPFPSTTGGEGYVVDNISSCIGVPIKEHTAEEKDAISRYMNYFSSVEGQEAFIGTLMMFSNVKDVPLANAEYLSGIEETIKDGRYFSALSFSTPDKESNISLMSDALAMTVGEKTGEQCIADNDAHPFKLEEDEPLEPVVNVAEKFTVLETSSFIADMYRETAGADIGLIPNNMAYRGNVVSFWPGELDENGITALKPRSFENDSKLIKVSMTGQQLLEALNHIRDYSIEGNGLYAFSGLKCTVAPWNPEGEKYLSVALADGTELDLNKEYTVALWDGTIPADYLPEAIETYEGTWQELMTEYLKEKGTIAPSDDGRITLVWE